MPISGLWTFLSSNANGLTAAAGVLTFVLAVAKYIYDTYQERNSLQTGFLTEIQRLLWVIRSHYEKYDAFKNDPLIPFSTDFYDKQVANVGKVDKALVSDVVRFYGFVKFLNEIQSVRKAYLDKNQESRFHDFYKSALREVLDRFETNFHAPIARHRISALLGSPATRAP